MEDKISKIDNRVVTLEVLVSNLDRRFERIEGVLSSIDQHIKTSIEDKSKVVSLEKKIIELEATIMELKRSDEAQNKLLWKSVGAVAVLSIMFTYLMEKYL